jgi:hypothetical protein
LIGNTLDITEQENATRELKKAFGEIRALKDEQNQIGFTTANRQNSRIVSAHRRASRNRLILAQILHAVARGTRRISDRKNALPKKNRLLKGRVFG